jgi:hypothetical protein
MLSIHLGSMLSLFSLLSLVHAQDGLNFQQTPNCDLPATTECLVKNSQYTVVGTVLSTTIGNGTDTVSRFSIQLQVNCVWASFIAVSDGIGLVGNTLTVANWGFPRSSCPRGYGSNATVGQQGIFFIYVAKAAPRGAPPAQAIFAVTHICAGPANLTDNAVVAQVLQDSVSPENTIPAQNRGTASFCTLPVIQPETATTTDTSNTNGVVTQSSSMGVFALFLFSCIIMSF